ncbi:FRG domain-containing protein [Salmonella enterica subsp. enterica serovar Portland]|nr:FRG domain-containing protein [Salmonella enterica subsp. enterica serovar Portland]
MCKIKTVSEYIEVINSMERTGSLYRGQCDINFKLTPSIFRKIENEIAENKKQIMDELENGGISDEDYETHLSMLIPSTKEVLKKREISAIRIFMAESAPYLNQPVESYLEILALAQHHGLPTRLLDWSLSPLVALYFSVETNGANDAVVYILKNSQWIDETEFKKHSKLGIEDYLDKIDNEMINNIFMPKHITPRIKSQQGVFSIHSLNAPEFQPSEIEKITIDGNYRKEIKNELRQLGIGERTIYPDLYGLCKELKALKFECND